MCIMVAPTSVSRWGMGTVTLIVVYLPPMVYTELTVYICTVNSGGLGTYAWSTHDFSSGSY